MTFLKKIEIDMGPNWDLYQTSLTELVKRQVTFQINHQRQRKYLYSDRKGGTGHKWQRQIFVSLMMGVPFPNFEINIDHKKNNIWIEDGQQRYKTFYAITNDMVKLPDLSSLGSEYSGYSNMCFSELPLKIQNQIFNQQMLLLCGNNLTQEELHKRFLLINNGTPLSQQDKRSAQISKGASYIQGIVDGIPEKDGKLNELSPKLNMFKMKDGEFSHVNAAPNGRALEETVAHWYNILNQGDLFQISQDQLNSLYKSFNNTDNPKHENYFDKILKQVDKCICSYGKPRELKGRTLLFIFFIVKHYMDSGYKINHATFVKNYLDVLSNLRIHNELITYSKKNGDTDTLDFKRLLGRCDGMDQINTVLNLILNEISMISNPIKVDARRVFTRDEKVSKLMQQGGCCGYCSVELKIDNSIGDHKTPYSHGGETSMDNLVTSCKPCNDMKSSLPYDLWEKIIPSLKDRNKKAK